MSNERASRASGARAANDPLLSSGEFARRSRLSIKALRLYDQKGLLKPAHVDRSSGYRRYSQSQLDIARLVVFLRRLDMPLAKVAEVVAAPPPVAAALVAAYWDGVERRIAFQRELAAHLQARMLGMERQATMFEIQEREAPALTVLTEQRHVQIGGLPDWIQEATHRLLKAAEAKGGMAGPLLVVYHGEVNEDSDGPVEVCVPIEGDRGAASEAAMRVEPAHREAYTRIRKAQVEFPQILSAYDAVVQWIDANGRSIAGSPREIYFADWDAAGPTDEVCDIAFPVQEGASRQLLPVRREGEFDAAMGCRAGATGVSSRGFR